MGYGVGEQIYGHLEFNLKSQKELHEGSGDAEEEEHVCLGVWEGFPRETTLALVLEGENSGTRVGGGVSVQEKALKFPGARQVPWTGNSGQRGGHETEGGESTEAGGGAGSQMKGLLGCMGRLLLVFHAVILTAREESQARRH